MLADDALGAVRETGGDMAPYERAFKAIDGDPAHLLAVGEVVPDGETAGTVIATFQLSFLPGISRQGAWRSQLEGVRGLRPDAVDHAQVPYRRAPFL